MPGSSQELDNTYFDMEEMEGAKFYSKNIHVNFISQVTGKIEIQKVIDSIEKFKLKQK